MTLIKNRGIIIFLLVIILSISFFSYENYKNYISLRKAFALEKIELQDELEKVIEDYDEIIAKKVAVSGKYRKERRKIFNLRDSIENLTEQHYSLFRKYRKRISYLEEQNQKLARKIDSLNTQNTKLSAENDSVKEQLVTNKKQRTLLSKKYSKLRNSNKNLIQTVAKAKELELESLKIIPLKRRRSGRYTDTSRSRKVEALKIEMEIRENEIAESGTKKVHLQIINSEKNIITPLAKAISKSGQQFVYSDSFSINYLNQGVSIVHISEIPKGSFTKGKYIVNIFVDYTYVGNKIISLR